jgi:hypothetical protein
VTRSDCAWLAAQNKKAIRGEWAEPHGDHLPRADCIRTLLTARRDGHDGGQPRKDETLGDTFQAVAKGLLMPRSNLARGLNCPERGSGKLRRPGMVTRTRKRYRTLTDIISTSATEVAAASVRPHYCRNLPARNLVTSLCRAFTNQVASGRFPEAFLNHCRLLRSYQSPKLCF